MLQLNLLLCFCVYIKTKSSYNNNEFSTKKQTYYATEKTKNSSEHLGAIVY